MMSNQLKCNIVIAAKKKKTLASGHKKSKIILTKVFHSHSWSTTLTTPIRQQIILRQKYFMITK